MAAVKGQPEPKPRNVGNAVPGASQTSAFDSAETGLASSAGKAASAFDSADTGMPSSSYSGPGSGALQTVADWAPAVGGAIGAAAGIPEAPFSAGASSVVGAGLGAMAGNSVRRLIEVNILGKDPNSVGQELYQGSFEAAKGAIGQLTGLGIAKAASAAANSKIAGAVLDTAANYAAKPMAFVRQAFQDQHDQLAKPVLDFIAGKASPVNGYQAGQYVRQTLAQYASQGSKDAAELLTRLNNQPPEQLMEALFNAKNAGALQELQKNLPEVFDLVTKSKMSDLVRAASPDGEMNLKLLQASLNKMPEAARELLLGKGNLQMINDTLNNPAFKTLEHIQSGVEQNIVVGIARAAELTGILGKKAATAIPNAVATSGLAKQMIGAPIASPLLQAYGPQQPGAQP